MAAFADNLRQLPPVAPIAASGGLELFAEHMEDAYLHPGNHPKIDHLFNVIAGGKCKQGLHRPMEPLFYF
ncbi:DUF2322 family protein [Diaphorobacter sp. HDW4B]|nr:DUF2322 family protein [Diaphorobacter sp. HDW4B]